MKNIATPELLAAALIGYQQQLNEIQSKIAEIRGKLGNAPVARSTKPPAPVARRKKRRMSAEGRARIAEAQRARWAKAKKAKAG
jgi:hypothetical protein